MINLLAIPNIVNVAGINIALLDVIALILVIIALIVGAIKGFARQALSILGFALALILSFVLCGKLASFINNNIPAITGMVKNGVEKAIGITSETLKNENALRETLKSSSIPAFLHELIISLVVESNFEIALVDVITGWTLNVISFITLLIVLLLGFTILKAVVRKIVSFPIIKNVDMVLGMIFSVLKCLIIIFVALSLASTIFSLNNYLKPEGVTCFLNSALETITNSSLFKNLISKIISV